MVDHRQRDAEVERLHGEGLIRSGKYIPNSPDCADELAAAFELFAQMADVDIEKAVVRRGFALEQSDGDLFARDDAAGGAHEHFEQVELDGVSSTGAPATQASRVAGFDAGFRRWRRFRSACQLVGVGAAQHGAIRASSSSGSKGLGR